MSPSWPLLGGEEGVADDAVVDREEGGTLAEEEQC